MTGVVYSVSTCETSRPPTMAMPSGRRSSAPVPLPSASGRPPSSAASVVIMMGRKRSRQAWWIASRGDLPWSRSASSAKSIIMMAFFLTMPISSTMPISAMTVNSVPADQQRQERAHARRRQRRQDRDRVDVALVEHAQHDVDGDQGGQDQQRLGRQRLAEGRPRRPGTRRAGPGGVSMLRHRLASRPGRRRPAPRPAPG